ERQHNGADLCDREKCREGLWHIGKIKADDVAPLAAYRAKAVCQRIHFLGEALVGPCLRAAVFLFIEDGVGVPDGRTLVPVEAVAGDIDLSADAPGCKLDPSRSIPEPVVGRLETDVFEDCLPEPVR